MKTVTPRFVRAHGLGHNSSMGASYQVKCPHCGHKNLAWASEWTERKGDRTNKCPHFDGFTKSGAFRFFKGLPITKANRDTPRWFKCVWETGHFAPFPAYRFGKHVCVIEEWLEEAYRFDDRLETRDIEAHTFAIKAPPAEWLDKARLAALVRSEDALRNADFLRAELARHYPGRK